MEEGSTLKLVMEKGPREGETHEFQTRCTVRIGRVVRGNSLAIKDDGVSSKHLSIQFDSTSSNWVLSDLDSSNGTFLNGSMILEPAHLRHGDTVKIGEYTSFKILIESQLEKMLNGSRNPRTRAAKAKANLGVSGENTGLGFGGEKLGNQVNQSNCTAAEQGVVVEKPNRRGRPRKAVVLKSEAEKVDEMGSNVGQAELITVQQVSLRRTTRCSKKKEDNVNCSVSVLPEISEGLSVSNCRELANLMPVEDRKTRRGRTRGRNLPDKPLEEVVERSNAGQQACEESEIRSGVRDNLHSVPAEAVRVGVVEEKEEMEGLNLGRDGCEELGATSVVNDNAVDAQQRATVGRQGCEEPAITSGVKQNFPDGPLEGVGVGVLEEKKVTEGANLGRDPCEELGTVSVVNDNTADVQEGPDLEKMTLGEWFDYLEVYLPKQIHKVTEGMISDMRQRAEQVHEFMLQQKNIKEKGKLPMD